MAAGGKAEAAQPAMVTAAAAAAVVHVGFWVAFGCVATGGRWGLAAVHPRCVVASNEQQKTTVANIFEFWLIASTTAPVIETGCSNN